MKIMQYKAKEQKALSLHKLAAQMDMVKDMLKDAERQKQLQGNLSGLTRDLNKIMASPDMNIAAMSEVLDQFGSAFTNMGVVGGAMSSALSNVTQQSVPGSEVDAELVELQKQAAAAQPSSGSTPASLATGQGQANGVAPAVVAGGPNAGGGGGGGGGGPTPPPAGGGGTGAPNRNDPMNIQARMNQMNQGR